MNYICNNIFMIRTPSLPMNMFSKFINSNECSIEQFIRDNELIGFMDKSILLASRELFKSNDRKQTKRKKARSRELSLIKYLIRASMRPTPYGLFAGVGLGEFDDSSDVINLAIEGDMSLLECRADSSWLSHLTYTLENNPVIQAQLHLRFNNNCYVSGDLLKNPHYSNHGFVNAEKIVVKRNHIRNTPLIIFIKEEAKEFIGYSELQAKIKKRYSDVPEETIVSTINMLMENEILFTNLRVPSNHPDGLEYLLRELDSISGVSELKDELEQVYTLIRSINGRQTLKKNEAAVIQTIYEQMDILLKDSNEKNLLLANRGLLLSQNKLPNSVKATIENFVEGTLCLQVNMPSKLEKFKQQFQEEYGTDVEVPLCEIIDPNKFNGLSYIADSRSLNSEKDRKIKHIVDAKILYCLQSGEDEVVLSRDDFSVLGNIDPLGEERLSDSFDINFFVTKEDREYILSLAPTVGSAAAGNMFNRFGGVLDSELFGRYKETNVNTISDRNEVYVEIRECNSSGRLGNINNRGNEYSYFVAFATSGYKKKETELSVNDLLIGMQGEELYIKSRSMGKRCKFVYDCMINKQLLSELTQLLLAISTENKVDVISRLYCLTENKYIFMPRIVFEGVVVYLKSWNFSEHFFNLGSLKTFTQSFTSLRKKYSIDKVVYLSEWDNRLPLDLEKDYALEILYRHVKKAKTLKLEEMERNIMTENICYNINGEEYATEISCSMLKKSVHTGIRKVYEALNYDLQSENRVMHLLQDGWIYIKLYRTDDRENEVLNEIVNSMDSIGNPDFFYLRYSDEAGNHLRVRFKYSNKIIAQKYLLHIEEMLTEFQIRGLFHTVVFDIYSRENNRYGGSELIEYAEKVFFSDSRFVISLLNEFDFEKPEELDQAYMLGICTILTAFFNCVEDMLDQVSLIPIDEVNKKMFRKNKQKYIDIVEKMIAMDFSNLNDQLRLHINERDIALKKYRECILEMDLLTTSFNRIISSIIHMLCNRLTGDRNLENRYLIFVRESLSSIIEKRKRYIQRVNNK